ncbi:MAG TPA: hypothetical protein VKG25_14450 [Bryobacteraceae bacterium]|nr:hypothetical protein [Bryobacteraceae bacterium]
MFELKPISHDSIPGALTKAEHYRLLNEPSQAESICRDILESEPNNQRALICLVLALSDQIVYDARAYSSGLAVAARLASPYDQAYYSGIVWERRARARHQAGGRDSRHTVYDWVVKALNFFAEAEKLRPAGNDDAILRWNTCVRFLSSHPEMQPRPEETPEPIVSE